MGRAADEIALDGSARRCVSRRLPKHPLGPNWRFYAWRQRRRRSDDQVGPGSPAGDSLNDGFAIDGHAPAVVVFLPSLVPIVTAGAVVRVVWCVGGFVDLDRGKQIMVNRNDLRREAMTGTFRPGGTSPPRKRHVTKTTPVGIVVRGVRFSARAVRSGGYDLASPVGRLVSD